MTSEVTVSNYPLHGTGRSGLHVLNHRARPALERERWASRGKVAKIF